MRSGARTYPQLISLLETVGTSDDVLMVDIFHDLDFIDKRLRLALVPFNFLDGYLLIGSSAYS